MPAGSIAAVSVSQLGIDVGQPDAPAARREQLGGRRPMPDPPPVMKIALVFIVPSSFRLAGLFHNPTVLVCTLRHSRKPGERLAEPCGSSR
jgi:hypothetical protein